MVQFVPFEKGMEIVGSSIHATIESASQDILEILEEAGFSDVEPDGSHWYSLEKWLAAFQKIAQIVGSRELYMIGQKTVKRAMLPPMRNLEEAMTQLDIAYHMNHRNAAGKVLYDESTSEMFEGIGHYAFEQLNRKTGLMVCETPYPCDFDRGLITGFARKFRMNTKVMHDDSKPCRSKDGDSCTYIVSM